MSIKLTKEDFVVKSQEVHGNKYNYSKSNYVKALTKLVIICNEHGEFEQTPAKHMQGQGCPGCKVLSLKEHFAFDREKFIEKAVEIHGDKYDYSKVVYVDSKTKLIIICKEHGEFEKDSNHHINAKKQGCPKCARKNGQEKFEYRKPTALIECENQINYESLSELDRNNIGIYKIEHVESGKLYIGSAVNIKRRFVEHNYQLRNCTHHNIKLQNSWNKYGPDAFRFEILICCEPKDLLIKEMELIKSLRTDEIGYNICSVTNSQLGIKRSEETKQRMSESQKGRKFSEEHLENMRKARLTVKRKPHSEETKQKMRLARIGKSGIIPSDKTRAKMSASQKGKVKAPISNETRKKLSESHKGQVISEETKLKLSKANKKYWSEKKVKEELE